MNYLSVASGISAETLAWRPLGWSPRAFAQFDPDHDYSKGIPDFASAVLAHHYPEVPNLGDMTKFEEWPDYAALDVLSGGTPCQSYSLAGLGAGLDDPRGDLALVYAAIARRYRPTWVVWENVGGVLSNDKGRAFASILGLLSGQRVVVPAGGWRTSGIVPGIARAYGLAWRVLDTQFVRIDGYPRALPQRRRRVFVVGYLGDWRRAAAVLFERESLAGNPPPSRRPGQTVAGSITRSFGVRGGVDEGDRGTLIPAVANPLTARMAKGVNTTMDEGQTMIAHPGDVAPTLLAGDNKTGGDRQPGMDIDTVDSLIPYAADVAPPLNAGNSQTGGGRRPGTSADDFEGLIAFNARQDPGSIEGLALPVDTDGFTQAVAFKASHYTRGKDGKPSTVAPALSADADKGDQDTLICAPVASTLTRGGATSGRREEDQYNLAAIPIDMRQAGRGGNFSNDRPGGSSGGAPGTGIGEPGDPSPTLGASHPPAVAFQPRFARNDRGGPQEEVAYPLTAEAGRTGKGDSAQCVAYREDALAFNQNQRAEVTISDVAYTLKLGGGKPGQGYPAVLQGWSVRRLLPIECERLQGVPDGFTDVPWRGKPAADGVRYKVLGNSQSVNVMRWIGWRIQMVDKLP